jgi:hypothetical protein
MSLPSDAALRTANDMPPMVIDGSLTLVRPATIKARTYWDNIRGERSMPTRQDISPRDMREFLAHVALFEIHELADGTIDYRIRLAGSVVEEVFGPIGGKSIRETLPPDIAQRWRTFLDTVRKSAEPLRVTSRVAFQNKSWLASELFLAPLGQHGEVTMLFGAADMWPVAQPPGANRA